MSEVDMDEFEIVTKSALQALERGERVAMATVVQARGSAPRHAGARMLVWPDGHIIGTVGGATLEERVIQHAQEALQSSRSRLEKYIFSTENDPESVGLCGGEVLVSIEVLQPAPTLMVIGAGHVALALSQMAPVLEMRLVVVDDRAEFLTAERFPHAVERILVQYDRATETLQPMPITLTPSTFVLVATWGWDEPALAQILSASPPPAYVGLISSRTKWRVIREMLQSRGIPAERLDQVHAPAGLNLGAETPGEIALSILAEMLAVREKASVSPMSEARKKVK
jgi:xanthine dehydrogenase accessory factor